MQEPSLQNIVEPLLQWFDRSQRDLPWREDREPYHVWVSEIMLQQTRIEAVKKYYTRFMNALPDPASLSAVEGDQLLKLWEGLGYYSRAKNLKKAAEIIMRDFGGKFPHSYDQLLKLPGIGEYTAGAIASICFDEKVTAIDGNVLRVTARVTGNRSNVLLPETKKEIDRQLKAILPDRAGAFNEALMELGEIVCLPNGTPMCEQCPIREHCVAYQDQLTAEIPVRIKKLKRSRADKTVLICMTADNEIAIEKRTEKGLLSGMYQLPNVEGFRSAEELKAVAEQWQLAPVDISFFKEAKHTFTHMDWYMKGYFVTVEQKGGRFLWVSLQELAETYPLPTAFQPFIRPLR